MQIIDKKIFTEFLTFVEKIIISTFIIYIQTAFFFIIEINSSLKHCIPTTISSLFMHHSSQLPDHLHSPASTSSSLSEKSRHPRDKQPSRTKQNAVPQDKALTPKLNTTTQEEKKIPQVQARDRDTSTPVVRSCTKAPS